MIPKDRLEEPEVSVGPHGSTLIQNPSRDVSNGAVELTHADSEGCLSVSGQYLDDRPSHVSVGVHLAHSSISLALDPDTARTVAADLDRAARGAEDPAELSEETNHE